MTGRVEEGQNLTTLGFHLIRADMLGDPARFAAHHVSSAQRIEQAGLAVIDVAHDRDHRRTRNRLAIVALVALGVSILALAIL